MKRINLVGQRFGRWLVVEDFGNNKQGEALFKCRCDCGNIRNIVSHTLRSGQSHSCGCLNVENHTTHKMTKTKFYRVYHGIKDRCEKPKTCNYNIYGGRGIKCLWKTFEEFRDDMFPTYKEGLCIDRIDNNGSYFKENCRWVTHKQNNRNTRFNKRFSYKGEKLCMGELSEASGIKRSTLYYRINVAKYTIDKALNKMVT